MSISENQEMLEQAVEAMNRIFDTPFGWLEDATSSFSSSEIDQYRMDIQRLIELISEDIIKDAITFMDRHKGALHLVLYDPTAMAFLPRSKEYCESFASKPKPWGELTEAEKDRHYAVPYYRLTPHAIDIIFGMFLIHESDLLRDMGFNQNSIAIIMNFLKENATKIKQHLVGDPGLRVGDFDQSASSLRADMAAATRRLYSGGLVSQNEFRGMKQRICAIATIVGDVMSLILMRDFGVASLVSTIAGASVIGTFGAPD